MKFMKLAVLSAFLLSGLMVQAEVESPLWNLPAQLNESNTHISFRLDSTWHQVNGTIRKLEGELWLHEPRDKSSVRGWVEFRVADMDTGNSSRDNKMRRVMHVNKYPSVRFDITDVNELCDPKDLDLIKDDKKALSCPGMARGNLSISGKTLPVKLKLNLQKNNANYVIKGDTQIQWDDFGVEDPSILVAYVDELVLIEIEVTLPEIKNKGIE
jgi:polyisoprenoid-binding protein YceI